MMTALTAITVLQLMFAPQQAEPALPKLRSAISMELVGLRSTAKATCILFITTDCPIANRYAPEIRRIAAKYQKAGVDFLCCYVDQSVGAKGVLKHRKQYDLAFPPVFDPQRKWIRLLQITSTPEATILDARGKQLYRGRIDDRYSEHGRLRTPPYRLDLRIALDEVLSGKPVSMPITGVIGCGIPD